MATPYARFRYETIPSTQDEAAQLLAVHPAVVVGTSRQTEGRGRHGRPWISAPQSLAVSVGFRPGWPPQTFPRITLVAGLAARAALGETVGIKWPNDLILNGCKLGGILAEADGEAVVVGLGVNLYWPDPPPGYGVLYPDRVGADEADRLEIAFADELLARIGQGPEGWDREAYRRASVTLGRRIRWEPDGRGRAVDIAVDGSLVVDTLAGQVTIAAGEVWEVRPD